MNAHGRPSSLGGSDVALAVPSLPGEPLEVVGLSGEERISRPYAFEVELSATSPSLPLEDLVGARVDLRLGRRCVAGTILRFEQRDALPGGRFSYAAAIGPRLSLLGVGRQSRIFQSLTVPEIVMAVCAGADLSEIELRLSESYPKRDYVVQYGESDLSFVSRLLEEEGISYFFEHDGTRERWVLCDEPRAFAHRAPVRYAADVSSLRCAAQVVPRRVLVTDQSDEELDLPLQADAEIDPRGFGLWAEHGATFADPEQGERIAGVRAGELRCRKNTFTGQSRVSLAAGSVAELTGHFRQDFNRPLLVVGATTELRDGRVATRFEAIPADAGFRPERSTPKPRVHGVMRARLDAHGPGEHAAVDERGRYRVVMPFDVSGAGEGRASKPMRLAQPYGAGDSGIHCPLPKGAEVVWSCIGGDPDRPVIAGAVAGDGSRRRAGPMIEMRNGSGRSVAPRNPSASLAEQPHLTGEEFTTAKTTDTSAAGDTYLRFKVPLDVDGGKFGKDRKSSTGFTYLRLGERPSASDAPEEKSCVDEDKLLALNVDAKDSTKDGDERWEKSHLDGVFDYTDGTRTVITRGNREEVVGGNKSETVNGTYLLTIPDNTLDLEDGKNPYHLWFGKDIGGVYRRVQASTGSSSNWFAGMTENYSISNSTNVAVGLATNATVGLNFGYAAVASLVGTLGAQINYSYAYQYSRTEGPCHTHASSQDIKGKSEVRIRVREETDGGSTQRLWRYGCVAAGAAIGVAAGALTAALTNVPASSSDKDTDPVQVGLATASAPVQAALLGTSLALAAKSLLESLHHAKDRAIGAPTGDPEVLLRKGLVRVSQGKKTSVLCMADAVALADVSMLVRPTQADIYSKKLVFAGDKAEFTSETTLKKASIGECSLGDPKADITSVVESTLANLEAKKLAAMEAAEKLEAQAFAMSDAARAMYS